MCHSRRIGPFLAILAALSILYGLPAGAQTTDNIEQNFASSLTTDTSGKLVESYFKSSIALKPFSQRQTIRIISKI